MNSIIGEVAFGAGVQWAWQLHSAGA
jgi:hypothetical protein